MVMLMPLALNDAQVHDISLSMLAIEDILEKGEVRVCLYACLACHLFCVLECSWFMVSALCA